MLALGSIESRLNLMVPKQAFVITWTEKKHPNTTSLWAINTKQTNERRETNQQMYTRPEPWPHESSPCLGVLQNCCRRWTYLNLCTMDFLCVSFPDRRTFVQTKKNQKENIRKWIVQLLALTQTTALTIFFKCQMCASGGQRPRTHSWASIFLPGTESWQRR